MSHVLEPVYQDDRALESRAYQKVTLRIIPFLFLCYVFAYLDRVNVGFAKLQMLNELHFSETVYGLGAGIFFIGYFLFEVPSNILLHKVGARRWIARIMISWGVVSGCMMFVQTPTSFYILRFLLGLAEAGFFPGIILYLTYWFPAGRRGKITALFMTGIPMAGVIGGPISGWIMANFHGVHGLSAWQWLFLLESIPSVVGGLCVLLYLKDRIQDAPWLGDDEKQLLQANIEADGGHSEVHTAFGAFRNRRVWVLCVAYLGFIMGLYGVGFWLPTLIKASGVDDAFQLGLLTSIPYAAATLSMVLVGRSSDRLRERRWHVALPAMVGAVALTASTFVARDPLFAVTMLTFATMGIMTGLCQFWCLPPAFLSGVAAATGIAMVNSVGNLAGFVCPYLVGWIKDATHSTDIGLYCIAVSLVIGGCICLGMPKRIVDR